MRMSKTRLDHLGLFGKGLASISETDSSGFEAKHKR